MTIRNILVPVMQGIDPAAQLDAALQVARVADVHITVIFVRPDATVVAASISEMLIASGVTVDRIEGEGRSAEAVALAKFEVWRNANNLALGLGDDTSLTCSASWHERIGAIETIVVEAGRLSDLIVINRPDPAQPSTLRAFNAAVFETGRPTLIVPETPPKDMLHHVVVAWNSSLEATRAVGGAMPLLTKAEIVSIFTAPGHAADVTRSLDLGEQLAWRGIAARPISSHADEASIGAALLTLSAAAGGTMLVMGAYTHSRVREMLLGGVTRHIIQHAAIPVLMMH